MFEALAGNFIVAGLMPLVLGGLAMGYLALRVRDARAEPADPQLGLKAAGYSFLTAGVLLALTGLSISIIDLLGDALEGKPAQQQPVPPVFNPKFGPMPPPPRQGANDPFDSVSQRVAWPLVISGVLFALGSLLVIRVATNDARFPATRRTFVGMRLAISGLSLMAGVTALILLLFQKEGAVPNMRPYAAALGLIIIWGPATLIHLVLLKSYSKLPYFVPPKEKKKEPWAEEVDDERHRDVEERPRDRRRPPRRRTEEDEEE